MKYKNDVYQAPPWAIQHKKEETMEPTLKDNVYTIIREFKAPQDLVYDTFTNKQHLTAWYKPPGFSLEHKEFSIKVGGSSLHALVSPDGFKMWELHRYKEVEKPNRLSYVHCFSNESGEVMSHPKMPNWPTETLITIFFEKVEERTRVTFHLTPHNASDDEIKAFNDGLANTKGGWTMAFDNLEKYITGL